ncbi:hypothetical protein NKR23_g2971 [Pleurostoma richardsiae]|uniref:Mitochondrial distribution and morphology protein 10 n=1 Tax=Pleurostoma richardsiae TaxID=41990 RepID=A0AA38RNE7_9PEZI|nr:hypothetical protein NKR23_g2971 [Pleurostoma richardsiae]
MRDFMGYLLEAYSRASGANRDNSYSHLNETANELLNFKTPRGIRMTLSSHATPHFASSYELGTVGVVDGSIAYLYSTLPLTDAVVQSDRVPLRSALRSYRQLTELPPSNSASLASPKAAPFLSFLNPASSPEHASAATTSAEAQPGKGTTASPLPYPQRSPMTLMFGRLYLPRSALQALIARRLTPTVQVQLVAVSDAKLRQGGTLLGLVQYDVGRFGVEGLASTDGGLLGLRGVYNFGGDASPVSSSPPPSSSSSSSSSSSAADEASAERDRERIYGRFSAGGEVYYGTLNKSGGMSLGARFATLPSHRGTPLTATLTINPLMGNISATYAVVARGACSLATRMEFNVYSYESAWAVGMELWSKRKPVANRPDAGKGAENATAPPKRRERSFQAKMEWRLDDPEPEEAPAPAAASPAPGKVKEEYLGVLKARLDQHLRIGLLWEGRVKSLLFSIGTGIDLTRLDQPFRTVGMEVQFSS